MKLTKSQILEKWGKEISELIEKGTMVEQYPEEFRDDLYYYFQDAMPYGTQKARTGDPDNYIYDHLEEEFGLDV